MVVRVRVIGLGVVAAATMVAACAGDDRSGNSAIVIDAADERIPFDRRLLGTNVPAWLGPELLADEEFRATAVASGVSLVRLPGGSWSNYYDWAGCEAADSDRCEFVGSARPTDFIDFMEATGLPGMWTLPPDVTAQGAAAAVAFFNGDVGDDRYLGVDRNGVDWGTVGSWAQVRVDGGHPDSLPIRLWEVGNEVYGGKPEAGGEECASFGWEDVWTCDGAEYVAGDESHDGYLAVRAAMLEVDPEILVGAVGVGPPGEWSNWGNEVIDGAGADLDMYAIHGYGFDRSPSGRAAIERPADMWPAMVESVRDRLDPSVLVAVTEYNLVSFEGNDTEQTMTKAMNALFIADSIGQLAAAGVPIANQWNLANSTTGSGTDYGMISVEDGSTFPQYDAMRVWSAARRELLPAPHGGSQLRLYPTIDDEGFTVIIINLSDAEVSRALQFAGASVVDDATMTGVWTDDLSADSMATVSTELEVTDGRLTVVLPPHSISALVAATP